MDLNLVHQSGVEEPRPASGLASGSKRDAASMVADAHFLNPGAGDFRVAADSPALKLGFKNFAMNDFGVVTPRLKAIARQPEIPVLATPNSNRNQPNGKSNGVVLGARARNVSGLGDRSAYGLPDETGVLVLEAPQGSVAQRSGLKPNDVIVAANNGPVRTLADLLRIVSTTQGKTLHLTIIRTQQKTMIDVAN